MKKENATLLKVFIADDSALLRERLRTLISELDAVELIGQASDAQKTIKAIHQLKPDVLILDIRMPGGNGSKVLESLKPDTVKPVVVVLTAFPYPQYRRKYLKAGADYFFDKATEFEQVITVLEEMVKDSSYGLQTNS